FSSNSSASSSNDSIEAAFGGISGGPAGGCTEPGENMASGGVLVSRMFFRTSPSSSLQAALIAEKIVTSFNPEKSSSGLLVKNSRALLTALALSHTRSPKPTRLGNPSNRTSHVFPLTTTGFLTHPA